jgi:D-alanyl-D-alanine carboxypeptidase/D-alanyl-D-alanine carboxypeptidase (penicillin-binding protein 5/6)
LLPSGNDAANAAAVRIAGSVEAFVAMMNKRAEEMGLTDTHFVTPSGLHAEGHYSTAANMAKLAGEAMKNPDFLAICSSKNMQLEYGNTPYKRWLKNSNKMLQTYEGAVGVKTGFTDEAGRCLIAAAKRGGVTLISVTLHDAKDWEDTKNLFDYGFSQVKPAVIPPDVVGEQTITVTGGVKRTVKVEPYGAATTVVPPEKLTANVVVEPFYYAPVTAGDIVGWVDYLYEGSVVATQPLMATETVEQGVAADGNIFARLWGWVAGVFEGVAGWFHP